MEIISAGTAAPMLHAATGKRAMWTMGRYAQLAEGQQPSFSYWGHSGTIEALVKGKPLQIDEEYRSYISGWNLADGLTNTTPRLYASMAMDINRSGTHSYQPQILNAQQNSGVEATQGDLQNQTFVIGCDLDGANCYDGIVESARVYARPAQKIMVADPVHLLSADFTGPAWLQSGAIPDLCAFDFGVADANRWCWNMADFGGDQIIDKVNGVALAATGTPEYQVNSGLLARGHGRRGVHFTRATPEYVQGATTSVLEPGNVQGLSFAIYGRFPENLNYQRFGSSGKNGNGYGAYFTALGAVACNLTISGDRRNCTAPTASLIAGKPFVVTCSWDRNGDPWADPVMTINGEVISCSAGGTAPSGSVVNANKFTIGAAGDELTVAEAWDGEIYEVMVIYDTLSTAQALALYKQSIHDGVYWTEPDNTAAHYKMNEGFVLNGIGLLDHSGNSNTLSVVSGTPDPQYRDMPWPAGTGITAPAVMYNVVGDKHETSAAGVMLPSSGETFSGFAWFRASTPATATMNVAVKGTSAPGWRIVISSANHQPYFYIYTSGGTRSITRAVVVDDGLWHAIAWKAVWDGSNWTPSLAVDGQTFAAASAISGDFSGSESAFALGASTDGGSQLKSVAMWKGYALTDADVAQLYSANGPVASLTYARTSTGAKGICYETAQDLVDGPRVTCFADGKVPYAYSSDMCGLPGNDRLCLAEPVHAAVANNCIESEAIDGWSMSLATVTADAHIAPDGTKTADTIKEDGTVASTHYVWQPSVATTVAQYTASGFFKALNRDWVYLWYSGSAKNPTAYLNAATCTVGATSAAVDSTETSLSGTWCRFKMTWTHNAAESKQFYIFIAEADGDTNFDGGTQDSVAVWGVQVALTGNNINFPYCPTDTSTQTCGAASSNYIAAANLTGWDKEEGVISSVYYTNAVANHVWRWKPTSIGAFLLGRNEFQAFNSSSVLQQYVWWSGATQTQPLGSVVMFDSQEAFYGTRRSALRGYGSDYGGLAPTYSTDTGANWTQDTGGDFHMGMNHVGGAFTEGYLSNVCIWKDR
jgi:hypothetical protein